MAAQDAELLLRVDIPQNDIAVDLGAGQDPAVWAERRCIDPPGTGIAHQRLADLLLRIDIPQNDGTVVACRR